ncbi:hypothetical protein BDQ12DRAFT_721125 [Crucibulum laeve]|uniref:Nucleosome assembly protein n=1 Tax=Crucibulum laeve TaxID=68775 RepID=A0A5C3M741_9AGAR|nr:hypothetical protein BDQ12DRAFT_721125 [Crucibulum laeve]
MDDGRFFDTLTTEEKQTVQGLRGIEAKRAEYRVQFHAAIAAAERLYGLKCKPLYERRRRIIAGEFSVSAEEIERGEQQILKEDITYQKLPSVGELASGTVLDGFWLRALKTHSRIKTMICEIDEAALKHLVDIAISYPAMKSDRTSNGLDAVDQPIIAFTLTFHFSPNEYFENSMLTKTHVYKNELTFLDTLDCDYVIGDKISWKPGQNLVKLADETKALSKANKAKIVLNDASENEDASEDDNDSDYQEDEYFGSFFKFFSPLPAITVPGNVDEYARSLLVNKEFEIGEMLKDRVVPRAVEYFTGDSGEYEGSDLDSADGFATDEVLDALKRELNGRLKGKGRE